MQSPAYGIRQLVMVGRVMVIGDMCENLTTNKALKRIDSSVLHHWTGHCTAPIPGKWELWVHKIHMGIRPNTECLQNFHHFAIFCW